MPLTGKFSFRRSLTGNVILTVEEEVRRWPWSRNGATRTRWRNASLWDLTHPEIRHLLEFRDGARPAADPSPIAAERARPPEGREAALLDGVAWRYPASEGVGRRANGH